MEKDLISVIIPMYNMEKFIKKCLDSVCAQSYKNLEIICVNDGSPDRSAEIAEEYAKKDSRIIVHHNPKNLGLFRARVEGYKIAKGKYIANVDADDTISVDWLRLLHKKAVEEDADLTIGNTVNVDENNNYTYSTIYRSLTSSQKTLVGEEVIAKFFEGAGSCFVWHTVWNKLYKKELVDKCLPYFKKIDFHLIMCEDIAFSSIYYAHTKKLAFADVDAYFYFRHSASSTSNTAPKAKIVKNVYDVGKVFDFVKKSLISYDKKLFEKYEDRYEVFKERFHRFWCGSVKVTGLEKDADALKALKTAFGDLEFETPKQKDNYFYSLSTSWSYRIERVKKAILSDDIDVVSFDIFDTLIQRPLYRPEDIHNFVGKYAKTIMPEISEGNYVEMRTHSQNLAYENLGKSSTMRQDIHFEDIFKIMAKTYDIPLETAMKFAKEEIRLEKQFCSPRKLGIEFLELAKYAGKKVIIISDMFLDLGVVKDILTQNGITAYDKLYLSSDVGLLKNGRGDLFKFALSDIDVKARKVLHIGDNWNIDVVNARNNGMNSEMIPKAIETYENIISDIPTGWSTEVYRSKYSEMIDNTQIIKQLPLRCMIATIAKNRFDNPYDWFNPSSKYNGDPYYSGYATMGMHIYGVAKWMLDIVRNNGYKKVVFLARDGYVIKPVFEKLCKTLGEKIETEYFYATRNALIPYMIKSPKDFYFVGDYIRIELHTPKDILNMFKLFLKEVDNATLIQNGFMPEVRFDNKKQFNKFAKFIIENLYDDKKCKEHFKTASNAFKNVFDSKTLCFDVGYSGRLQNTISELAGVPVDVCFIHSNGDKTKNVVPFKIYSFLNYTPAMSSIVREFLISEPAPSCIKYEFNNNKIIPILDTKVFEIEEKYPVVEYQKGAVDFCLDFIDTFKDYLDDFIIRPTEVSAMFDYFMLGSTEFDRSIFACTYVEDFVYSGYKKESICKIWNNLIYEITHQNACRYGGGAVVNVSTDEAIINFLENKSKFKRAIFWLLFDRKKFKEKFKKNIKKRK